MNFLKKWALLLFILCILMLGFFFELPKYLSIESLRTHHSSLLAFVQSNMMTSVALYFFAYFLLVCVSLPGASFLSIVGGYIFGPILAFVLVLHAATFGALVLFIAIERGFTSYTAPTLQRWLSSFNIKKHYFTYLLFLRLIPLFPFWVVNLIPALLGWPKKSFFWATYLGIIPGVLIYTSLGTGLQHVLSGEKPLNIYIIFEPYILIPLLGLALIAIAPTLYRAYRRNPHV